ncbi:DNA-binding transcriptional LysR family regulator [Ewingella americana]
MLDHETIRSFVKVAECCSFSRAAESLHKTSATISYRIKVLEEGIGTQLFLRTTRSVTLTPAGSYYARTLPPVAELAGLHARRTQADQSGR